MSKKADIGGSSNYTAKSNSGRPSKRSRLPSLRPSYRTKPGPEKTEEDSKGLSTSWITTVKNSRSSNRNMAFEDTKLVHENPINSEEPSAASEADTVEYIDSADILCAPSGSLESSVQVEEEGQTQGKQPKRKRDYTTKSRLIQWLGLRDSTLDELLRHDGLGSFLDSQCSGCGLSTENVYRCRECGHGSAPFCQSCLISNHADLPLHRIEHWNGTFYEKISLSSLGLRVQLGHDGRSCPCPEPGPTGFTVFDTTGAHIVNIDYCGCTPQRPLDRQVQILRTQWFPATAIRPRTAFTFRVLDTFHESTLQGKGNLYDYYNTLLRMTDNANISASIYRFPEMHRVFRLWRNLMAWKRAGRGHNPSGIDGTGPGEMTMECPACPHPGCNLPDGWQNAGPLLYLYTLFIAVDANFKLKGKDRKLNDVDFVPGTGVFVDQPAYQKHISNYVEQPEMNTCRSEHDAIVRASIQNTPGYAVSGVGLVLCSRHSLVRRNGVGDLQKGERYCNMDFIVLSALVGITLLCVLITYDIACQWSKNLDKHMLEFPEMMKIPTSTKIRTAIPSWHINGHGPACRDKFNLGYTKGVGRTCGEEVETNWSHTNPLAASVREMAPAARRDALNDHWNGWNFRKIVGFRTAFAKKFKDAVKMKKKHDASFNQFSSTFQPDVLQQWTAEIEAWEKDPSKPNPYKEPTNTVTLQDTRLELQKEEAAMAAVRMLPPHKVSMTGFLITGLDLEDHQYKLRVEVANRPNSKTTKKQADIQEKRMGLLRQINNWRQAQLVYTPHVANLIAGSSTTDENGLPRLEMAKNTPLFLPSSLPAHVRAAAEMKRICDMEFSLRKAAAYDALAEIRRGRRNVTKLWKYKKINVNGTGNRPNTRMLTVYNRVYYKIERAVHKYRRARSALVVLDPEGLWMNELKDLRKEDVRGPGKDPNDKKQTHGRYEESWIWLIHRSGQSGQEEEEEFNVDMRVEWAKSRARLERWKEEYLLLQEEMRRVLAWYAWKASWWEKRSSMRIVGDSEVMKGIVAYSHKQARVLRRMGERCAAEWIPLLRKYGIEPEWAPQYAGVESLKAQGGRRDGTNAEEEDEDAVDVEDGGEMQEIPSEDEDEEEEEYLDDDFEFDD